MKYLFLDSNIWLSLYHFMWQQAWNLKKFIRGNLK
jgi:hypothetical protein